MLLKPRRRAPSARTEAAIQARCRAFVPIVRAWAESIPFVRRAWIFGSHVHKRYARPGDLDVAIEFVGSPGGKPIEAWDLAGFASDLERLLGGVMDVDLKHYAGKVLDYEKDGRHVVKVSDVWLGVSEHGLLVFDGRGRDGDSARRAQFLDWRESFERARSTFRPRRWEEILA